MIPKSLLRNDEFVEFQKRLIASLNVAPIQLPANTILFAEGDKVTRAINTMEASSLPWDVDIVTGEFA